MTKMTPLQLIQLLTRMFVIFSLALLTVEKAIVAYLLDPEEAERLE
jgi:hypothetical protein